ncbi:hypothetical protein WSM22_46130 [Cytophagales bacterium WSM2-2]|nr:hypothetical protein WSM22_46130 [Cytophagales bacterium WSM2-2]
MISLSQDQGKSPIPLDHFYAKPRHGTNVIRTALRNVRFGLYTGLGRTYFSNHLDGYGVYQAPGQAPELFTSTSTPSLRYTNWINDAGTNTTTPGSYVVANPGTSGLGFKGHALNLPLGGTVHYEFDRYRVGGGYSYELMSIGTLHSQILSDKISDMTPASSTGFVRKYWVMAGASFYRWNEYLFSGDLQVGSYKLKGNYNTGQVVPSVFFNLGVTIEQSLSEYFRVYARPYYEIKSYDLTPPGATPIHFNVNALYVNVGFTYSIPELPRCFLNDCHVQINHAHGNKEYRSRRHPIYKKQNPGYGENDPTLIKYKGRNKNKLNPY